MIVQEESTEATHLGRKPSSGVIKSRYRIDEELTIPEPEIIVLVDDIITTGAHFMAAKSILSDQFLRAAVIGIFIARRVRISM